VVVASETEARKDAGVCINVSGRLVKGGASARTLSSSSKTKGATRTTTPPRRERADAAYIAGASGGGADSTSCGQQAPHTGVSERSSCCLCLEGACSVRYKLFDRVCCERRAAHLIRCVDAAADHSHACDAIGTLPWMCGEATCWVRRLRPAKVQVSPFGAGQICTRVGGRHHRFQNAR
jgi:hypothetical protein